MPKRNYAETRMHKGIVQFLRTDGEHGLIFYHSPQGRRATEREGAFLKSLGVLAGVPDLCFVLADGRAAFMEIKAPKGRCSEDQRAFLQAAAIRQARTAVVYSLEEAIAVLGEWGVLRGRARIAV